MRRLLPFLLLLAGGAPAAGAQRIPGRDLLQLPLGSMDQPAALGGSMSAGLGNPATILPDSGARARIAAGALQTPPDEGITAQLISVAFSVPGRLAVGLSAARVSVDNLFRTETDPQTVGGDIPYGTTLFSLMVAREQVNRISVGLAARYRLGELDGSRRGAFGLDGGILAEHLTRLDASLGAATFLWQPANASGEQTTVNVAGDLRVAGRDERHQARAGYGSSLTDGGPQEDFGFVAGRYGIWEVRAGLVRLAEFGSASWHNRLALRLHYGEYLVGLAREENGAGLGGMYQFMLTAVLR